MENNGGIDNYINSFSKQRLSKNGKDNIKSQFEDYTDKHTPDEFEKLIVQKYFLLSDEIHKKYSKSKKILLNLKVTAAVFFVLYSLTVVIATQNGGNKMLWLVIWILIIFLDAGFFMIFDYCNTLFREKVFPYLDNVETIDFGIEEEEEAETGKEDDEDDF